MTHLPELEAHLAAAADTRLRRRERRRFSGRVLLASVLAFGTVGATAAAVVVSSGPNPQPAYDGPAAGAPGADVVSALTAPDAPSAADGEQPVLGDDASNPRLAKSVRETDGSTGVVAPGQNKSICHAQKAFANCPAADVIRREGFVPSIAERNGLYTISAIVVDGIERVTIVFQDGTHREVAIRDNVMSIDSDVPPVRATWTDARGHHGSAPLDDLQQLDAKVKALAATPQRAAP